MYYFRAMVRKEKENKADRNKERPGSTFKITSTTKSPITTKQSNSQQPTKPLQRTYSIESMVSDTDRLVASLNVEEIIKNYNT